MTKDQDDERAAVANAPVILQHLRMIHVLFSSAAGTLRQVLMARGEPDAVAHFTDTLDWGPIQTDGFVEREKWFDRIAPMNFGACDWLEESAAKFRRAIAADPERLIWISPRCQRDLSGLHWFLEEFGGAGAKMIIADHPLHRAWRDEPPLSLSALQEDQIVQLLDDCQRAPWDSSTYPEEHWRALMAEDTCLRIVDSGKLRNVNTDYFDDFLLARCPTDWTKSDRLIGDVMGEIWDIGHNLGAAFLYWRLRELVKDNKIASDGRLPMFGDPQNEPKVRLQR